MGAEFMKVSGRVPCPRGPLPEPVRCNGQSPYRPTLRTSFARCTVSAARNIAPFKSVCLEDDRNPSYQPWVIQGQDVLPGR